MFRSFVVTVLGFLVTVIVTYLIVVFGVSLAWDILGVHDQDGGGMMALGLVIAPGIAIASGVVGAIVTYIWYSKRKSSQPTQGSAEVRHDTKRFIYLAGAVVGGIIGHYVAQFGFWLASPIQFDTYWKAWAVSWLPMLLTLLGAICGSLAVRQWMHGK